uniref:Uncharacterized protein n=1 Tax=Oryza rufipogon TaxID=4529 RepID=A0A0E0P178_ORYRU
MVGHSQCREQRKSGERCGEARDPALKSTFTQSFYSTALASNGVYVNHGPEVPEVVGDFEAVGREERNGEPATAVKQQLRRRRDKNQAAVQHQGIDWLGVQAIKPSSTWRASVRGETTPLSAAAPAPSRALTKSTAQEAVRSRLGDAVTCIATAQEAGGRSGARNIVERRRRERAQARRAVRWICIAREPQPCSGPTILGLLVSHNTDPAHRAEQTQKLNFYTDVCK